MKLISAFFFLSVFTITAYGQSIEGDALVCAKSCNDYTIIDGKGGPYLWSSDIGRLDNNKGEEVTICWESIGEAEVSVLDLSGDSGNQRITLKVEVVTPPSADLYFPEFPVCIELDTMRDENPNTDFTIFYCETVCAGSIVQYGINSLQLDSNYVTYEVTGGDILYDANERGELIVAWGEPGFGNITVEVNNIAGCTASQSYCIEILDNPEVTIVADLTGTICTGQDVTLKAESENAVSYYWSIEDEFYGTNSSAVFAFDVGGSYIVELIANTDCMCADTFFYNIEVTDRQGPQIDCISTTHVNESQIYYALDICSAYNWSIGPQGTIVDGGGIDDDYIEVIWNDGPLGEITLSTDGCEGVVCTEPTIEYVPVFIPNLEISGPSEACNDGSSFFSLPLYPGTTYNWSITGNGTITDGWGTNEIVVTWDDAPWMDQTATITVMYENCLLECTGAVTKNITLLSRFEVGGEEKLVCQNDRIFFYSISGYGSIEGDWTITDSDGVVVGSSTNETRFNVDATFDPGFYEVTLSNSSGDFCNEEAKTVFEIAARPAPLTGIDGPINVCKGERYLYTSSESPLPSQSFTWTFSDNGTITTYNEASVFHTWDSDGPYSISVTVEDNLGCESDPFVIDLMTPSQADILGDSQLCLHETGSYEIDNNTSTIGWEVVPSGAGSIFTNEDGVAEITWHLAGTHTLTADYCSASLTYNVEVLPQPDITVSHVSELCADDRTAISVTSTSTSSTIEVTNEDDVVVSDGSDVGPGFFYVELTDGFGCTVKENIRIDSLAPPAVSLTTPDNEVFCLPSPLKTLYAVNSQEGYTYEWYRNGVALGVNTETYETNDFGEYQVEVTDVRTCSTLSNTLELSENCRMDTLVVDICNSKDSVSYSFTNSPFCNEFQFTNTSSAGHDPTSIQYQIYDPVTSRVIRYSEEDPVHIFSAPGFYKVYASGNVPDEDNPGGFCKDRHLEILEVPIAASYHVVPACVNSPAEFIGTSTFLSGRSIVSYAWDFGDPASGVDNTSTDPDAIHTYTSTGTYLVSLTIESDDGCLSRVINEVDVLPDADVDFVLPRNLCVGEALKFVSPANSNLSKVKWTFDDPNATAAENTVEAETAIHYFSVPGTYDVTLEATNIYDCSNTITKSVTVDNSTLSGDITKSTNDPVCEGEFVLLTAPTGVAYIWSTGETTASIEAYDQGIYRVTVTNADACNYVPEEVSVDVIAAPPLDIVAFTYPDGYIYQGLEHYNSLSICQGDRFELYTNRNNNYTYSWNIGGTSNWIFYNDLSALVPDDYNVVVTITDNVTGCTFDSDPFILSIHERPASVTIVSDATPICAGETYLFSIDNPQDDLAYYWNNGMVGVSIEAIEPGEYYVTAVNQYGCERRSNRLYIQELPDVSLLYSGCIEVCLPQEICLPRVPNTSTYEWLLDGVSVSPPSSNTLFTAQDPGDYQIVATSFGGCIDTSDVFTLYPEPQNHTVNGIVYVDENDDGVYDPSEMLLEDAKIYLVIGNVRIDSTTSDAMGAYQFTGVNNRFATIEIDPTSLSIDVDPDQLVIHIEFDECMDVYNNCDFHLNSECVPTDDLVELTVCSGEEAEYEGLFYPIGTQETFVYTSVKGCDSIIVLSVLENPPPIISGFSSPSCFGQDNGTISIDPSTAIDLDLFLSTGQSVDANFEFSNLSPGSYVVTAIDDFGCEADFSYTIAEYDEVDLVLMTGESCEGLDNGTLEITSSANNIQFSINGGPFIPDFSYTNLASGTYDLSYIDENDCVFFDVFTISEKPAPQIGYTTSKSCQGENNGSIELSSNVSSGLTMILDNGSAVNDQFTFDNISVGNHTIMIDDGSGCPVTIDFMIEETITPTLNFTVSKTCIGDATAELLLEDLGTDFTYALSGGTYTSELNYPGLPEGQNMITVQSSEGCTYDYSFNVETYPEINTVVTSEASCPGMNDGNISIEDVSGLLEVSIDDINYFSTDIVENLQSDMYQVYVRDENNCILQLNAIIDEAPELEVDFPTYDIDCTVKSVMIEPIVTQSANTPTFTWSDGQDTPLVQVASTGLYSVEISDKCSSESFDWDLEFIETEAPQVYTANIFNPAATDPVNKTFKPLINDEMITGNYKMEVYDRWGNVICASDDINIGWDGLIGNDLASNGVYLWSYEIEIEQCGELYKYSKKGSVTIVK